MSEPATTATPDYLSTVTIGQVIRASVAEGQVLAVVAGLFGDRLGVASNGRVDWIRPQDVADLTPGCRVCGQAQWWWDPLGHVSCSHCRPPNPDWSVAFKELSNLLTLELPPDDPRHQAVEVAVRNCDEAWLDNNWPVFQASIAKVQWAVLSGLMPSPGGCNE